MHWHIEFPLLISQYVQHTSYHPVNGTYCNITMHSDKGPKLVLLPTYSDTVLVYSVGPSVANNDNVTSQPSQVYSMMIIT